MHTHRLMVALACLFSGLLLFTGCEKNRLGTIDVRGTGPVIVSASVTPSTFNVDSMTAGNSGYSIAGSITVSIRDQLGSKNLRDASFSIVAPNGVDVVASGALNLTSPSVDSVTQAQGTFSFLALRTAVGSYALHIVSANLTGQTSTERIIPITLMKNAPPPALDGPTIRLYTPNGSDSTQITVTVAVSDSNGDGAIRDVRVRALNSTDLSYRAMLDNGAAASGDRFPGDGIYSIIFWTRPTGQLEDIALELSATDTRGQVSSPIVKSLANHAPHITALNVPSSIPLPQQGFPQAYVFTATVTDFEGVADIDSVYFRNYSASSPTNILMFDDGDIAAHGDSTAHNGVFSRIIVIDATASTGVKEFHFFAVDKSGARDERVYPITIIP